MEKKLKKIIKEERIEIIGGFLFLIILIIMECLAVKVAVVEHNYLLLSVYTYVWVLLITECFVKKYVFEKIVKILLKRTSISNLVFFILACITFALSWKYFIAFIFCIPQAILYGEYCKLKS